MSERLTSKDFRVGMKVRIRADEIKRFNVGFAKKVVDREAVVLWVSKYDNHTEAREDRFYMAHVNKIQVEFQKRNGRGKEFKELLLASYFEIIE